LERRQDIENLLQISGHFPDRDHVHKQLIENRRVFGQTLGKLLAGLDVLMNTLEDLLETSITGLESEILDGPGNGQSRGCHHGEIPCEHHFFLQWDRPEAIKKLHLNPFRRFLYHLDRGNQKTLGTELLPDLILVFTNHLPALRLASGDVLGSIQILRHTQSAES
jgi:hypothetical protein